jgi:hypothetical protein
VENSIFVVNEEPYCVWEVNLLERNIDFLNGIDIGYFDYALKVYIEATGGDDKRTSIALRIILHHAIETMYSLLGAYIQSPQCAYAWIAKCTNTELRKLVENISNSKSDIFTKLNIEKVTWECISESVFRCYLPKTEKNKQTAKLFASFWRQLSEVYIDKDHIDEYNSIKHGFRIRAGGFALAVGLEHEHGVHPPPEEMKLLGKSDYGTSFFRIEPVGKDKSNRSLRSRKTSLNWTIERTISLIQLITMSIKNITCALKIVNGVSPEICEFSRPQDNSYFDEPWSYSPGITSCNMDYFIPDEKIPSVTKNDLLKIINAAKKKHSQI